MGWIMVASGFADRTDVSQYRLVAHLLLALVIYGALLWSALDMLYPARVRMQPPAHQVLRRHGWIMMAVIALGLYVLFVLAGLASVNAALTLPGIAGLILSIGMAVDANVLIFERIREELSDGRSPRMAVNEGFANALSAIVDAQLTTLLTAGVLFQFGTGPVRGFAVTLAIGIVASMFTAIFVTRTFFMLYLQRRGGVEVVSI